jgi:hypothetical protein
MSTMHTRSSWDDDDSYWRSNYRNRPYASASRQDYDYYQPGYRYGYDAATRFQNRDWTDVENDLAKDWESYEHRGTSTWEQMKDVVRDAWDRVTGRHTVHAR